MTIYIYSSDVTFFYFIFRSIKSLFITHNIEHKFVNKHNIDEIYEKKNNYVFIFGFDFLYDVCYVLKKNIYDYLPKHFIYYHSEPLDTDNKDTRFFSVNYVHDILPKAMQVWNYSPKYNDIFNDMNINSIHVPLSYTPFLELSNKCNINEEKTIDVLIYGLMNDRKQKIINDLQKINIKVYVPNTVYDERLDILISKSKIILSVYFYENKVSQPFDFSRLIPIISKKGVVVAEISHDDNLNNIFKNKINLVTYDNIVKKCKEILDNYDNYKSQPDETYKWFKTEYDLSKFIDINYIKNLQNNIIKNNIIKNNISNIFTNIFDANIFYTQINENGKKIIQTESKSGGGSTLKQTEIICKEIPKLLESLNINSLLDIPCGDFNWMKTVPLNKIKYIGGDIVSDIIDYNIKNYTTDNKSFQIFDIVTDNLPAFDIILCRDCWVHLPNDIILQSIKNLKKNKIIYLLTTTFPNRKNNRDINMGDWRPINLNESPFCLPKPLLIINENCTEGGMQYTDKSLGLWKLSDINII